MQRNDADIGVASLQQVESHGEIAPSAEDVRFLPLGRLHLDASVVDALKHSHVITVGQLLAMDAGQLAALPRLGPMALRRIKSATSVLLGSIQDDQTFNWPLYCERLGIQLIPISHEPGASHERIVQQLPGVIREVLVCEARDERLWIVIQQRFGFDREKPATLQDIADALGGLSRERIRQLEVRALDILRSVFIDEEYAGKSYRVRSEIQRTVRCVCTLLKRETQPGVLEAALFEQVRREFGVSTEQARPTLRLLLDLAGARRIAFQTSNLTPIWVQMSSAERKRVEQIVSALDRLLTEQTSLPLTEFDCLLHLNKPLKKSEKITLDQFRLYVTLCASVERRLDGTLWGKFECLRTRTHQVERVLTEHGSSLHGNEIAREINHRAVSHGWRNVSWRTLGQQVSADSRFVSIGRSGEWKLATWDDVESADIVTVMEHYLITRNTPATADEIFAYVSDKRPVGRGSIDIYLASPASPRFRKMGRDQWGLANWKPDPGMRAWNPEEVAGFVATLFKQRKAKILEYREIKGALMDAGGLTARQAQGLLNHNPVIKTQRGARWSDRFAVFQPEYREALKSAGGWRKRRKLTLREQVDQRVRRLLENAPGEQMPLAELIAQLQRLYRCPDKTLYHYIAALDYVERIAVRNGTVNAKICRIRRGNPG